MYNSKLIKTIISFVLSVSVLMSISVPFVLAEDTSDLKSDAQKAYNFLKAVGAMDSEEVAFDANLPITRAHFVKLALHLSDDAPEVLVSDDEVFSDVNPSTQYESYIETAYRIGYISGSSSSLFEPGEVITLAQSLKILCNVLGYQKFAEANGGFPGGYMIMAQRLELLDGVELNDNQELDMANAMILMRNAVETKLMQITGFGDGLEMETVDDETLLSENHNIGCEEGVITANSYTDLLSNESELDKNQIMVNNLIFSCENADVQDYIGYRVRVYYKNDENKTVKSVVYAELTEENTEYEVTSEEISVDSERIMLEYEDGSSKNLKLSSRLTYILNGKMAIMTPEDLLSVDKGSICFISNDDDKTIDVIKVKKYDTLIVSGISASSGIIIATDGTKFEFDPDSDEYTFSIFKNGTASVLSSLAQNDVLLVSEGKGTGLRHIEILASDIKIEGAFDEIGDGYVTISGKQYDLDTALTDDIVLGKAYVVYVDSFGSVAYVKTNNDIVYGYLYGLIQQGMNMPQCRIFTENNRWVDLYFANKVKFNGETVDADALYAQLKKNDDFRQLIRYNVNDNREVIRLETATEHLLGSAKEKSAAENDEFRISYTGTAQFRSSNKSFDGKVFVDPNAKIFNIPADLNKDEFAVKAASVFSGDTSYSITAYDADKYMAAKAVVTSSVAKDTIITSNDKFMVVKNIGQTLNSDGDAVPSIKGYWNDSEISFPVLVEDGKVSSDTLNSLKKGDVILFKYDDDSNIIAVKRYSLDDESFTSQKAYYGNTNGMVICGRVDEIDALGRKLRVASLDQNDNDHRGVIYTAATSVSIWEKETETYRTCTANEILPGDIVFMNMRYFQCNDIVIVRN